MMGSIYMFQLPSMFRGVPSILPVRCLNDTHARQEMHKLSGVVRVTEGGRQVWPRPERPLHDQGAGCA
jgi:hypothetical protein